MKYKDYYAILGVTNDATADEIKTAYRRLARKYHPDVSKEKDAEEKFKEMGEAYETLKDAEKRAAYDQLGTPRARGGLPAAARLGPRFAQGAGGSGRLRRPRPVRSLRRPRGTAGTRRHGRRRAAPTARWPAATTRRSCACRSTRPSRAPRSISSCGAGMGARWRHAARAASRAHAHPEGRAPNGEKLRVPGKGGKGANGGPDGDLYLDIEVEEHPLYRVTGNDIYVDLPLAPWEAVLGTSVSLPTPAGTVSLKVRPARAPDNSFV